MFKKPFSFNGRIRRTEFAITFLIYVVFYVIILVATTGNIRMPIFALLYIPLVWFAWAQSAKRCHDVGKSGWWQIIPFYIFWLLFQKGDPWANQYDGGGSTPVIYGAEDYERPYTIDGDNDAAITPGGLKE